MDDRKELIELEILAKVHALKRDERVCSTQSASKEPPTPDSTSAADENRSQLLSRFRKLPVAFSWKGSTEKIFVRLTQMLVWSYVAAVPTAWLVLHFGGQRGWLSTLLLLGPRWAILLPLIFLIPLAAMLRLRLLLPLFLAGCLACFAIVGVCVRWPWQGGDDDAPGSICMATCDVQSQNHYWQRVRQLFAAENPDVVALQQFGSALLIAIPRPMHVFMEGQLVLASRYPFLEKRVCRPEDPATAASSAIAIYALLDTPSGPLGVCNLQLASLAGELDDFVDHLTFGRNERQDALNEVMQRQDRESQQVAQWLQQLPQVDVILGRFGMPVESRGYRCWDEYDNAFSHVGHGLGFTQRITAHRLAYGLRTDHILVGDGWKTLTCTVGLPVGSERLPLFARVEAVRDKPD